MVLRHEHRAGEKAFVDYAGQTVPVIDPKTGEVRQAQVFVAVLGAKQLHLRRSHLDAEPVGLDSLACAGLRVLRWNKPACDPGQLEVRREQALLLRAGTESHLWRSGDPLWRGHPAGATVSPEG